MPHKAVIFAVGVVNGIWYTFTTPPVGQGAIFVELIKPIVPTVVTSRGVGMSVQLQGLSLNTFDHTSITSTLGGSTMPADFLVNSHSVVKVTFVQDDLNVTPDTTTVTVLDHNEVVLQTSDGDTLETVSAGIQEFTILPETFEMPGVYKVRWLVTMPDDTQLQFDVPVTVDSEVR